MDVGGGKKDWENPPAGMHPARIVGVYDIGTQPAYKAGDNPKPQVIFVYELVGKAKMKDGSNFTVAQYMGRNNHSNGALIPTISAVTGVQFKQGKADKQGKGFYFELPDNFGEIFKSILGKPVLVTLVAKDANGGVKVSSVAQPMDGMAVAEANSALGWLDFSDTENFSSDWMAAPKWIQDKASKSSEMAPAPQAPAAPQGVPPVGGEGVRPHEDDLPSF